MDAIFELMAIRFCRDDTKCGSGSITTGKEGGEWTFLKNTINLVVW